MESNEQDVSDLIEKLRFSDSLQKPYFGILEYGGGPSESFIKANKQGLILFALELLESSQNIDEILEDKEKTILPFDMNKDYIDTDSSTFISFIEPIKDVDFDRVSDETQVGSVSKFIIITILLILLTLTIIGVITIMGWLF